jgi:hypothetical protein
MSKSASKRLKGKERAQRRAPATKPSVGKKTVAPIKRTNKNRPWREQRQRQAAIMQPPLPVLFVSLDRYSPDDKRQLLAEVEVPPPIVVPLDDEYLPKASTKEKLKQVVPPPIVVPLDRAPRKRRRRNRTRKKIESKALVPPPIVVPLDKFHQQAGKNQKKKEPVVPPPIFVPLEKHHQSKQTRRTSAPVSKVATPPPIVVRLGGLEGAN